MSQDAQEIVQSNIYNCNRRSKGAKKEKCTPKEIGEEHTSGPAMHQELNQGRRNPKQSKFWSRRHFGKSAIRNV